MTRDPASEPVVTRRLVVLPLAALSLVFVGTIAAALVAGFENTQTVMGILALGLAAFLAVAFVMFRKGSEHLTRLQGIGQHDTLTGLPNRRAYHADFAKLQSNGDEIGVGVLDLDGFLQVNEQYGHGVGDAALCECAKAIQSVCDKDARVYRLGGDEFALLCSGPVAGTILEGISRRIVEQLSRTIKVESRGLTMGASIGLARSTANAPQSSSEILRQADVAMYASKRGGKGRCTWFSQEFDITREQTREMDNALREALSRAEFQLHYQPLIDTKTGQIVAAEALIRWQRENGEMVGPNQFIPIAEQSGLINPIGLWVLRRACLDALNWDNIKLSVNISAAQLRNPEFPIQLGHILEETGFAPDRLELEITETCLVLDPVLAERSLALIRGFGVNVVLDDFGTGYASIGFLRQFRFEKLKLDRSLVVGAGEDEGSRAMMLSSITVARSLKMEVTAEGVETAEQADMVRAAGCDQIQGYLYYRPMPADEFSALLREQAAALQSDAEQIEAQDNLVTDSSPAHLKRAHKA